MGILPGMTDEPLAADRAPTSGLREMPCVPGDLAMASPGRTYLRRRGTFAVLGYYWMASSK